MKRFLFVLLAFLSTFAYAARYFDGVDDYIQITTTSVRGIDLLYFTSHTFTISVWVKPTTTSGELAIFSKITDDLSSGYELYVDQNLNRIYFDGFIPGGYRRTYGSAVVSTSVWTHIAVVKSTYSTRVFVNGIDVTTEDNIQGYPFYYTYVPSSRIGTDPFGSYFQGYIAEFGVCGCVHSSEEIRSIMNMRRYSFGSYKSITFLERTIPALFIYYPFDSITINQDYSGQGHNVESISGTTMSLDHPPIKALRR